MRILMLTQSYPPVVGGEERAIEDLAAELAGRDHEVTVATLRQPGPEPRQTPGVRVRALRSSVYRLRRFYGDPERRHAPPLPDPETVLDLRRLLFEERPDVVHAHNWAVHSYLPLDRDEGPALALSLHDYSLLCATKRMLHRGSLCSGPALGKCTACAGEHYGSAIGAVTAVATRLGDPRLRRHVDLFLPVSGAVEELCRVGPGEGSVVVPNFFRPPSESASADRRLERLPREPFLLFFGDATPDKGAALLADAYSRLVDPPPLVFLGRRLVDGLAERPGVTALGPWPHALAMEAVRRSELVAVPSIWPEPFGLVALEAAAAGKPVVAAAIGGLRDIVVDGETGLLVEPGDGDLLRAALQRLIADPALGRRLGEAAAVRVDAFGAGSVVPRFERAYEHAIERRRARRGG
jgi:glycosyltransferase involved in cell wall biosynthesis